VWSNVPSETLYVQYEDGDTVLWQTPVSGIVIFPYVAGDNERVNAIDHTGTIVASADHDIIQRELAEHNDSLESAGPDLGGFSTAEVESVVESAARRCLSRAGASDPGVDIPDADEIWARCLDEAQQAATEAFVQLIVVVQESMAEQAIEEHYAIQTQTATSEIAADES